MNGLLVSGQVSAWDNILQISVTHTVQSYIVATESFLAIEQFKQMYNNMVDGVQAKDLGPCQ